MSVEPPSAAGPPATPLHHRIAPVLSVFIIIGGIALLMLRDPGTGADTAAGTSTTIDVRDSTTPTPTSPPFVQPTTTTPAPETTAPESTAPESTTPETTTPETTAPATSAPGVPGPTQAEVDAALISLTDLDDTWTQEVVALTDVCGVNPELEFVTVENATLFQQIPTDQVGLRQLGNRILSFPDPDIAARAFATDLQLVEDCSATTIDLEGVPYRVAVTIDEFDNANSTAFACNDQNASLLIELTNDAAPVPYIGQTSFTFRCGVNVTVTSLTTSLGRADLTNDAFVRSASTSNIRTAALTGSS